MKTLDCKEVSNYKNVGPIIGRGLHHFDTINTWDGGGGGFADTQGGSLVCTLSLGYDDNNNY
jgi:hypothetical protein